MADRVKIKADDHGERKCYDRGCRCDPCTAANARHQQRKRRRARERAEQLREPDGSVVLPDGVEHGSDRAYGYWVCRCEPCRAGHATRQQEYRASA